MRSLTEGKGNEEIIQVQLALLLMESSVPSPFAGHVQ